MTEKAISPPRRRMIEDMSVRNFVEKTKNNYVRLVKTLAAFFGSVADMAALDGLRRPAPGTGLSAPSDSSSRFWFKAPWRNSHSIGQSAQTSP